MSVRPVSLCLAVLAGALLLAGCASDGRRSAAEFDLGIPDTTAQQRQAIELVNRGYELYHDEDRDYEKRSREAAELFRRAISLDPGFASAHFNLGVFYLDNQAYPSAIQSFRTAQILTPADSRAAYHLGVAYASMRRHDRAIEAYQDALLVNPNDLLAMRGLMASCRRSLYADHATLEAIRRGLELETSREWRGHMEREVTRQEQLLELG
ncbi:MAG: tetratricopeptide repeat protein [Planctomycetota bacterium]